MAVDGSVWSDSRAVLIDTTFLVVPCFFFKAVAFYAVLLYLVSRFSCPMGNCLSAVHVICCHNMLYNWIASLLPFVRLSTCVARRSIAVRLDDKKSRTAPDATPGQFL